MEKDVKWSDFFEDNRRYADIINAVMCGGQQIVSQEDLMELDTRSKKKFRDVVRRVALGVNFAIIGIENQDEIDYELPVRIMEYDVARYRRQISEIRKEIREKSKSLQRYKDITEVTAGRLVPAWMDVDAENFKGTIKNLPTREEIDVPVNEMLIVELYSK